MADKEATVFVVDVSHHMARRPAGHDGTALEWCLEYIWDKLGIKVMASRKTDYVAVIAVGSAETDHAMGDEESYQHIRVILPFPRRTNDDLRSYTYDRHLPKHIEGILSNIASVNLTSTFCSQNFIRANAKKATVSSFEYNWQRD